MDTVQGCRTKSEISSKGANYYGSIHPMCEANYLAELTEERTNKLRTWLTGAPEGDACSGSVNVK